MASEIVPPVTDRAPPGRKGRRLVQSRCPFAKTPPGRGSLTVNQPPAVHVGTQLPSPGLSRVGVTHRGRRPGQSPIQAEQERTASETLQTAVTGKDGFRSSLGTASCLLFGHRMLAFGFHEAVPLSSFGFSLEVASAERPPLTFQTEECHSRVLPSPSHTGRKGGGVFVSSDAHPRCPRRCGQGEGLG